MVNPGQQDKDVKEKQHTKNINILRNKRQLAISPDRNKKKK